MVGTKMSKRFTLLAACAVVLFITSVAAANCWDTCCWCGDYVVMGMYESPVLVEYEEPCCYEQPCWVVVNDGIAMDEFVQDVDEYGAPIAYYEHTVAIENACIGSTSVETTWPTEVEASRHEVMRPATEEPIDETDEALDNIEIEQQPMIENEELDNIDAA